VKRVLNIAGIAILLCAFAAVGTWGQAPEEKPASPPPPAASTLPLDPQKRDALEQALKARNYDSAEKLLVAEIDQKPKSPELLKFLASVFFLDAKYLNTAVALKKAEAIKPLDNPSRFTLALAYIILNHRDWARPELETLARSEPTNVLYPYWLGRIDYDAMQFTSAVSNFTQALQLDPEYMKSYDNLGLCYEALGKHDEAIKTYQEAVRRNNLKASPSPWPPLNLGALLIKLQRLDEAEPLLRDSLRYDPRFPQAHYQLGLLLEKQKKDGAAVEELRQAASLKPDYAEPHYVLGRIYQRQGDTKNAEAAWAAFQRLKKEDSKERPH